MPSTCCAACAASPSRASARRRGAPPAGGAHRRGLRAADRSESADEAVPPAPRAGRPGEPEAQKTSHCRCSSPTVPSRAAAASPRGALAAGGARSPAQITVRVVGADEGRALNRDYRGQDHATNVLTFDYQREPVVVADLVLCAPVVAAEARADGKTLDAHYAHLLVHGALHAQGYDHETRAAERMEARESELLVALGYPDPYRPERRSQARLRLRWRRPGSVCARRRARPRPSKHHGPEGDPEAGRRCGSAAGRRSSCRRSR